MVNPGNDKPDKSPGELEHLHDVTFEKTNMDTTPLAPSPSPSPTVQGGKKIANPGASSSSKGQLLHFRSGPYSCRICCKPFPSPKAVCGHMRVHKPPKEKAPQGKSSLERECAGGGASSDANARDTLQEELAPGLLNLAPQVLLASSSSCRPDGLVIDLNQPDPCSLHEKEAGQFDLNKPPPAEEEDGDR